MNRLQDKRLTFPMALLLIITTWIAVYSMSFLFISVYYPTWLLQFRTAGIISVYIIVALYVEDKKDNYENIFMSIWRIDKLMADPEETISLIISALEMNTRYWADVHDKYDKTLQDKKVSVAHRNGILTKEMLKDRSIDVGLRIIKGKMTIPQIIWVGCYIVYCFVISTNFLNLDPVADYLVSTFALVVLTLSNNTEGLGEFLQDIYKNLKSITNSEFEEALETLRKRIINLSHTFYLVQNAIDKVEINYKKLGGKENGKEKTL